MPMMTSPEERKRIQDQQAQKALQDQQKAQALGPPTGSVRGATMPGRVPAPPDNKAQMIVQKIVAETPLSSSASYQPPAPMAAPEDDLTMENSQAPAATAQAPMSAPGPQYGSESRTQQSVSMKTLPPEQAANIASSLSEANAALGESANAQAALATQTLKLQDAELTKREIEIGVMQANNEKNMLRREANLQEYNTAFQKYSATKIENPWSNMSTGAKIMAGISIALGGIGGVKTGGNVGFDVIQKNIEQDIDIQKANMDKKKGELSAIQQYGKELQNLGADDLQVRQGMLALGQKSVADRIASLINGLQPNDPRSAKAMEAAATFKQKSLDNTLKASEQFAVTKGSQTTTDVVPLKGPEGLKPPDKGVIDDLGSKERAVRALEKLEKVDFKNLGPITGRIKSALSNWVPDVSFSQQSLQVSQNLNAALKALTGAQMTDAEYDRLSAVFPAMIDNPAVFKAKVKELLTESRTTYKDTLDDYSTGYNVSSFRSRQARSEAPAGLEKN